MIGFLFLALVGAFQPAAADPVRARMDAYNRALGVECVHCHVQDRWKDASKDDYKAAAKMGQMVEVLNKDALKGIGEVGCWTCHRGNHHPSRLPRPALDAQLAKWPAALSTAPEAQKITMSVYNVSLGVGCDHCHDPADWNKSDKKEMQTARRMIGMFDVFPKYMPASARTQCYMCHKGAAKPPV